MIPGVLADLEKRRILNLISTQIGPDIAPDGGLKGKLAALVAFGDP